MERRFQGTRLSLKYVGNKTGNLKPTFQNITAQEFDNLKFSLEGKKEIIPLHNKNSYTQVLPTPQ